MSFNNNYSYYNVNTPNSWWGIAEASKFDGNRTDQSFNQSYQSDFSNPPITNMVLPSNNNPNDSFSRHEVVQGKVTQLFTSFGYINDNIIFSKTDVSGQMVKVGDQVIVETSYQPNNPMKYKGERVIKVDNSRFESPSIHNSAKMKPLSRDSGIPRHYDRRDNKIPEKRKISTLSSKTVKHSQSKQAKRSPERKSDSRKRSVPQKKSEAPVRRTSNETPKKKSESPKVIDISTPPSKSPTHSVKQYSKSLSENRQKDPQNIGRAVKIHKTKFSLREMDCPTMKMEHGDLNIPKDFFHISLKYQSSFPLNHPMKLGNRCQFKIMDRRVECPDHNINQLLNDPIIPSDADTSFIVKVILLSMDDLNEFYKQTLRFAEEFEGTSKIPITKAIKFLVASKGEKHEYGIGGAWSPSLDGEDPEINNQVLINTAIRTVKTQVGIDLSSCSSWPKFLEFHYYRPTQQIKTNVNSNKMDVEEIIEYREPKMETVVYFLPDVWNILPDQTLWNDIKCNYQNQLDNILCPPPPKPVQPTVTESPDKTTESNSIDNSTEEEDYENDDTNIGTNTNEEANTQVPTHYSKLNIDSMKVADLKQELEYRKMNNRGVMAQLKARLKSILEKEEQEEKSKETITVQNTEEEKIAENGCKLSEQEKNEYKTAYELPNSPHILVHINKNLTDGSLRYKLMSLHSLLSYQNVELDEESYELVLLARQFLQMLKRDAIFNLYKFVVVTPEENLIKISDVKKPTVGKSVVTTSKRTVNRQLLFYCTILDKEHNSYIDIEALTSYYENLGICLSSNQLSSVISKLNTHGKTFEYRSITDKEVDETEMMKMLNAEISEDLDYINELALGNKALFECEEVQKDESFDDKEVERLKTQIDKSERCRQTLQLQMSQVASETNNYINEIQHLKEEVEKLRCQSNDYRRKYYSEQERADHYKHSTEKFRRDLDDIQFNSDKLYKLINATVDRHSEPKKSKSVSKTMKESTNSEKSKQLVFENSGDSLNEDKSKIDNPFMEIILDSTEDDFEMVISNNNKSSSSNDEKNESENKNTLSSDENIDKQNNAVIENNSEKNNQNETDEDAQNPEENLLTVEDFELSKPDDIVILDEAE